MTPNIPILHFSSTSKKHKRTTSRAQNVCSDGEDFWFSECVPHENAQAFALYCIPPLDRVPFALYHRNMGACQLDEICIVEEEVDALMSPTPYISYHGRRKTAYCVGNVNFQLIQQSKFGVNPAYYARHVFPLPSNTQRGVVATLVAMDNRTSVFADRILIQAEGGASAVDAVNGPKL